MKKWMLRVLICAGLMGLLCLTANAATGSVVSSGSCGDDVTYKLYSDSKLVISGSGAMANWSFLSQVPWNANRNNIKTVIIEDGVTTIGDDAFSNCTALTSVSIPDSVTMVGDCAFYQCTALTFVTIPDSVISMGHKAFYECASLVGVDVGNKVNYIGNYTFYFCTSLKSVNIGSSVTSIGKEAFFYCTSLTGVVIPDTVIDIGDRAFHYCINLDTVKLGSNVATLGDGVFYHCSKLSTMTIPNSVRMIGEGAFKSCTGLSVMNIGAGVCAIGNDAFYKCTNLTKVQYHGDVISWCSIYFGNDYANPLVYVEMVCLADKELIASGSCGGDLAFALCREGELLIIGNGEMTDWAAWWDVPWNPYGDKIKVVNIGGAVRTIGELAFSNCFNLAKITIPNGIKRIGAGAFRYCSKLEDACFWGSETQWEQVTLKSGNDALVDVLFCDEPVSLSIEGIETFYPIEAIAVPTKVTLNLASGKMADVTALVEVCCDFCMEGQEQVEIVFGNLRQAISVTVYSGAHATIQIVDVHSATLKFYAQQAGQAFVAFYDRTTGQMLDAQVFTMPTGNSEVTLTAEEIDLMSAECKIILLDSDRKPVCAAIEP